MRAGLRFLVGVLLGGAVLAGYLVLVGVDTVLARVRVVTATALTGVVVLVALEAVVDGLGVWASVRPLQGGLSGPRSVQFALAGDFFDVLSPAGPVSSEPVMARFFSVATGTGYADALGVRSVAKYVKAGAQLAVAGLVGLALGLDGAGAQLLRPLGLALAGLLVLGALLVLARRRLAGPLVAVLAPLVRRVSGLYREAPHDHGTVRRAVERFWERVVRFRDRPGLLALIAAAGVAEQTLTAAALWVALEGTGAAVALLPLVVVVPLPQAASVVPIPGSLGAYEVLAGGAVVLATGVPGGAAVAAVLLVRTVSLPLAATVGGLSVATLRGWRPGVG